MARADQLGPNLGRGHLGPGNDDDSIHIVGDDDRTLCGESLATVANATGKRPDGMEGCWRCLHVADRLAAA